MHGVWFQTESRVIRGWAVAELVTLLSYIPDNFNSVDKIVEACAEQGDLMRGVAIQMLYQCAADAANEFRGTIEPRPADGMSLLSLELEDGRKELAFWWEAERIIALPEHAFAEFVRQPKKGPLDGTHLYS